jgi:hypothetical protein
MGRLGHVAERDQDLLILKASISGTAAIRRLATPQFIHTNQSRQGDFTMLRTGICLAVMLAVSSATYPAAAQTAATPAATTSKMRLTRERLKDMRAKWTQNKSKLAACRKEVKSKGLAGDDRWFFIEDCMGKS